MVLYLALIDLKLSMQAVAEDMVITFIVTEKSKFPNLVTEAAHGHHFHRRKKKNKRRKENPQIDKLLLKENVVTKNDHLLRTSDSIRNRIGINSSYIWI